MFYPSTPFLKYPKVESQLLKRNPSNTEKLVNWLCQTPNTTTYRVNLLRATPGEIKNIIISKIKDKYNFIPTISFVEDIPEVLCVNNLDNKCFYTDDLKECREVVVDAKCGAAVLRGAHIYAPGVLGMESGVKLEEKVCVFADLSGRCKRGRNVPYECEFKMFIGLGIVKMQRYQLFGININLRGIAIEILQTISGVPSLGNEFLPVGDVLLQNFPSIVCCRVLNPQSHERILDMCAAPGNKTSHIMELMKNRGTIIALDKTKSKIQMMQENLKNFQTDIIKCFAYDATKALKPTEQQCEGTPEVCSDLDSPPFYSESFDRILLDAPCSGLGNRPMLANQLHSKMLESYPILQRKLFRNAVGLLRPGGVLVYSTCTVAEDENELIVKWALEQFSDLNLVAARPIYGGPGLKNTGLNEVERTLVQRFSYEENKSDIDSVGFFIAKFCKSGNKAY